MLKQLIFYVDSYFVLTPFHSRSWCCFSGNYRWNSIPAYQGVLSDGGHPGLSVRN